MNKTNSSISTLTENFDLIFEYIGYYCKGITCFISLFINLFIMNLLKSKTLKYRFYKHISVITIIDILINFVGIGYFYNFCFGNGCQINFRYEIIVYKLGHSMCGRIMFMISSLHEFT